MGCDIHLFVEHKKENSPYWECWGGEFSNRNYVVFAQLAGVRGGGIDPISVRGVLEDSCWQVKDNYLLSVTNEPALLEYERYVSKEVAQRWVSEGASRWFNSKQITNPDWHSASWCTLEEFTQRVSGISGYYDAIIAACKSINQDGDQVRLVYWFDN